jgi:hypothetical protein
MEAVTSSSYFAGVAALNQYIYVVGGYDGHRQLNTVERYDTEKDSWDSVSSIRTARSALSLTVLDGKLYAMGKYSQYIITLQKISTSLSWFFFSLQESLSINQSIVCQVCVS